MRNISLVFNINIVKIKRGNYELIQSLTTIFKFLLCYSLESSKTDTLW